MGELRITDEGLLLDGRAEFTDPLYAVDIAAYQVCLHKHHSTLTHCTEHLATASIQSLHSI